MKELKNEIFQNFTFSGNVNIMNLFVLLMFLVGFAFAQNIDVYVYKSLDGDKLPISEARLSSGTVTMYAYSNGTVLDTKTTNTNGIASFNLPDDGSLVYFVAIYGNSKYLPLKETNEKAYLYYYDSQAGQKCVSINGQKTCPVGISTLWPTVQPVPEKNSDKLTVYVYDSTGKKVDNAYVSMYRASDDSKIRGFYTDSKGKAVFSTWHFTKNEQVYFKATKEGKTYESVDGKSLTFSDTGTSTDGYCQYSNGAKAQCKVSGYALAKELPSTSTVEKNKGTFTIYVYDSSMNKIGGAKVEWFKADEIPYASTYANSNGEVTFNEDNLPDGVQFYFVASKDGKTYESIYGKTLTFADSGNNVDGYCQYKNGVKDQCKITGYALSKEIVPQATKPQPTKVLENKISVYVYDIDENSNSVKVPGASITMYSSSWVSLETKTSDSTGIASFTLPTEGSLVYFVAIKGDKTFDSYSEKPSEFMLYYDIGSNLKCVSKNGNKDCSIKVHTLWPNSVVEKGQEVVKNNKIDVYVYKDSAGGGPEARQTGASVVMYKASDGSVLDKETTNSNGIATFELPGDKTKVYFIATYGSNTYFAGLTEKTYLIFYDPVKNKKCSEVNGAYNGCTLAINTLWPVTKEVAVPTLSCTDSDGKDIYKKGSVTGWDATKSEKITVTDSCAAVDGGVETDTGAYVVEEVCDVENKVHAYYYQCASGYSCNQGACVKVDTLTITNNQMWVRVKAQTSDEDVNPKSVVPLEKAVVYMFRSFDGKLLDTKVTDKDGVTDLFTIPSEAVYFKAFKDGVEYIQLGSGVKNAVYYYDSSKNQICNVQYGEKNCNGLSGINLNKKDYSKESNLFLIYVYKETFNEAIAKYPALTPEKNVKISVYRLSNDSLIATLTTANWGAAEYYLTSEPVYFKAEKDGKIYSDISAKYTSGKEHKKVFYFDQTQNKVCTKWSDKTETNCNIASNGKPAGVSLYAGDNTWIIAESNQIQILVYDKNNLLLAKAEEDATVNMYRASDGSIKNTQPTNSKGQVIFTLDSELVYFKVFKNGIEYQTTSYVGGFSESEVNATAYYDSLKGSSCVNATNADALKFSYCGQLGLVFYPPKESKITPETEIGYSLTLNKGWNLFSVPFTNGKMASSTCGNDVMFGLNEESKKYYKLSLAGLDLFKSAYWMKAEETCAIDFKLDQGYGWLYSNQMNKNMKKGWNIINAPYDRVSLADIAGNCELKSGPWYYDTENKKWAKSQLLESSRGYIVKVAGDCTLGSTEEVPPALPSE